jgi:SAM-dependent methyltransferase
MQAMRDFLASAHDEEHIMNPRSPDEVRSEVQAHYGAVARRQTSCCGGTLDTEAYAREIGYSEAELRDSGAANLGLGCGNPTALARLRPGQVVVDLGAGAGFDALLAAQKVGPTGRVIGVDMTPDMLRRARENAVRAGVAGHVEFREGIIEKLPVVDESADVLLSNCVINLSPDKPQVFREAFRILKPGGELAISDILLSAPLAPELLGVAELYAGCIAGALVAEDYLRAITDAGFTDLRWERTPAAPLFEAYLDHPVLAPVLESFGRDRLRAEAAKVFSYAIHARKP